MNPRSTALYSAMSDIRTLLNRLGYQQHFDYQPTDLIGWAVRLVESGETTPIAVDGRRLAYHAGYYAALKACYPGQIPITLFTFWDEELRRWVGADEHRAEPPRYQSAG